MKLAPTLVLLLALQGCCLFRGQPVEVAHDGGTTESGVQWRDTLTGVGRLARPDDRVTVHYTARVSGGPKVDSTHDRGEPETFDLRAAPVPGWEEAITGMREGGKRWLSVPPERAFGEEGVEGLIPPNATLEFLIELLEVHREEAADP